MSQSTTTMSPPAAAARPAPPAPTGRHLRPGWVSATALTATLAPAWLLGSMFHGSVAPVVLVAVAAASVILSVTAAKTARPGLFLTFAPILLLGITYIAASQQTRGNVLKEAWQVLFSGQLASPPVIFSPGWQLLTAAFIITLGVASVSLAFWLESTVAAAALAVPAVIALALIQPPGRQLIATLPALVLIMASLAFAQRGERARDGQDDPLSLGDIGKVILALAIFAGLVIGATRLGFLGTVRAEDAEQPARPPVASRLDADGEKLFTLRSQHPIPLRVGVLDTYDGDQWWTPTVPADLPKVGEGQLSSPAFPIRTVGTAFISIDSTRIGRFAPTVPGTFEISGLEPDARVLPENSAFRLPVAIDKPTGYSVRFAQPDVTLLERSEFAPASETAAPGPVAKALVDKIAADASSWERIQHVRNALFDQAKQDGQGEPTPVSPARVDEILEGSAATGFEIAAADALLVRWAGIDSRIGYGYYNNKPDTDGSYSLSPKDGAAWVEVKTEAGSWVALTDRPVGSSQPQRAKVEKLVPNGERITTLSVFVHRPDPTTTGAAAAWWLQAYIVAGIVLVALWMLIPWALRQRRARRRRIWAEEHGERARIAVAYAQLRDTAIDLNIGSAELTPLEFLEVVEPDEDHRELAWLVERALWGDLRRDLQPEDAENAERLVASLRRRMVQGQTYAQRVLGFASHASLQSPWQPDMPNPYPETWRNLHNSTRSPWIRRAAAGALALILIGLPLLIGIDRPDLHSTSDAASRLPEVPASVEKTSLTRDEAASEAFEKLRDRSLLDATDMYLIKAGDVPAATIQTGVFKPGLDGVNLKLRSDVLTQLGMTDVVRIADYVIYYRRLGDLTIALSFSPDGKSFRLLTAAPQLEKPREYLARLIATVEGKTDELDLVEPVVPDDIRRGRGVGLDPEQPDFFGGTGYEDDGNGSESEGEDSE